MWLDAFKEGLASIQQQLQAPPQTLLAPPQKLQVPVQMPPSPEMWLQAFREGLAALPNGQQVPQFQQVHSQAWVKHFGLYGGSSAEASLKAIVKRGVENEREETKMIFKYGKGRRNEQKLCKC
jgi:hypothetical protein